MDSALLFCMFAILLIPAAEGFTSNSFRLRHHRSDATYLSCQSNPARSEHELGQQTWRRLMLGVSTIIASSQLLIGSAAPTHGVEFLGKLPAVSTMQLEQAGEILDDVKKSAIQGLGTMKEGGGQVLKMTRDEVEKNMKKSESIRESVIDPYIAESKGKIASSSKEISNAMMKVTIPKIELKPVDMSAVGEYIEEKLHTSSVSSTLLSTTIRDESDPGKPIGTAGFKDAFAKLQNGKFFAEFTKLFSQIASFWGNLWAAASSFRLDWKWAAAASMPLIVVADTFQERNSLRNTVSAERDKLMAAEAALESYRERELANNESLACLRADSLALVEEVNNLMHELHERSAQVTSLNTTLLSIVAGDKENAEIASLERALAMVRRELVESESKRSALAHSLHLLREEEAGLSSSVTSFLVDSGLVSKAEASMVSRELVSSLLDGAKTKLGAIIAGAGARASEESDSQTHSVQAENDTLREKLSEALALQDAAVAQLNELREQYAALQTAGQTAGAGAHTSEHAGTHDAAPPASPGTHQVHMHTPGSASVASSETEKEAHTLVRDLTAENDDLKSRLSASDERLWEVKQSLQTELEVAKETIASLQTAKTKPSKKAPRKATAAPRKTTAAPRKTTAAPRKATAAPLEASTRPREPSDVREMALKLKEMRPTQIKRKTKKELESILIDFGDHSDTRKLTKDGIIAIIEKRLVDIK